MDWLRIHVSNLCNFKCPNCHVFELGENNLPNRVMSAEIFNQSIDQFLSVMAERSHKEVRISLYGGETLANKKVIKAGIERYGQNCNGIEINWVLNTNGSLLDEADILFLKKHNVEIHISVDGDEDIHNLSRPTHKGKGTFHMVTPALELIKKHSSPGQINSYMMPSNYLHLKQIVDIAEKYSVKKIYLDQFYNLDMISHKVGMEKYRDVFFYAAQKGISISGPWAKVIERFQNNERRYDQLDNKLSVDVNIDGSYYFPFFSVSKNELRHVSQLKSDLMDRGIWKETVEAARKSYAEKCHGCPIEEHCLGAAIEQVHYHIGQDAETKVSCDFFRDWCGFLLRPVYLETRPKFDLVSAFPVNEVVNFCQEIDLAISELEERLWPLKQKIIINLVQYPEELRLVSHQHDLPDWVHATTLGKNHFFHLGTKLTPALYHELGHLFINQQECQWPQWWTEGFCEWIGKVPVNRNKTIKSFKEAKLSTVIFNGKSFLGMDSRIPPENPYYLQAHAFVEFVHNTAGSEIFSKIVDSTTKEKLESAMLRLTGVDLTTWLERFDEIHLSELK